MSEKILVPSDDNLRQIIRILVGLMDSQEEVASQCILPYDTEKVYQNPQMCVYNNGKTLGFYMCKYTTSGEWNPNSWFEICSVEANELSPADIDAYMNGVSQETWDYFKNILQDSAISTTKTWSSSKIYENIQESYADSVAYTVKYVAKAKLITYKKVVSVSDVTDDSTLYLVPDASGNYSIWVLDTATGNPLQLSETSIDLSDYYTISEIDSLFLKQTDASSTYKDITSYGTEQGNLSFTNGKTNVTDAINENKRLIGEVDNKFSDYQEKLTFDQNPVQGSSNVVTSGGIFQAIANTDKKVGHVAISKKATGTIDYTYKAELGSWQGLCEFKVDVPGVYFVEVTTYYYSYNVSFDDCSHNFSLRLDTNSGGAVLSDCEREKISSCLSPSTYNIGTTQGIVIVNDADNCRIIGSMYCPTAAASSTGIGMHVGYCAVKIG